MQLLSWSMTGENEAKRSQSANSCENNQRIRTVIKTEQTRKLCVALFRVFRLLGTPAHCTSVTDSPTLGKSYRPRWYGLGLLLILFVAISQLHKNDIRADISDYIQHTRTSLGERNR